MTVVKHGGGGPVVSFRDEGFTGGLRQRGMEKIFGNGNHVNRAIEINEPVRFHGSPSVLGIGEWCKPGVKS